MNATLFYNAIIVKLPAQYEVSKLFDKKKEPVKVRKEDIDFYIEQAKMLASPYEEQYKQLYMLNDYITNDIASDWIWNDLGPGVMHFFNQNLISKDVVDLYKEIDNAFCDVSMAGALYNEYFWTLSGLKHHPLWEEQRQRARAIISALAKVEF